MGLGPGGMVGTVEGFLGGRWGRWGKKGTLGNEDDDLQDPGPGLFEHEDSGYKLEIIQPTNS